MLKLRLKSEGSPDASVEVSPTRITPEVTMADPDPDFVDKSSSKPASLPRLSLSLGQQATPRIRVKTGKPSFEGYDSEAPDKEEDPTFEEAIVLRMLPGAGLDYLAKAVESNDMSNISVKFEDARRAVVTINGELYAAQLVDLPTITEVQKTFDRKNIYKTTDISQMLLVTAKITKESELTTTVRPEPPLFPHGIAPPLHNVRNRRFHQRMSNKAIEAIENKVDELFRKDAEALEVEHKLVDPSEIANQQALSAAMAGISSPSTTAAEDDDDEQDEDDDDLDDALGMELERALEADNSDAEGEEDDDDDDDDDDDLDEEQQDTRQQNKLLKEEIRELQATIDTKQRDADNTVNQIMKGRLIDVVNRMKKELDMKYRLLKDVEEKGAELNQVPAVAEQEKAQEDEDEEGEDDDDADGQSDEEPRSETPQVGQSDNQKSEDQSEPPSESAQEAPDEDIDMAQVGEQLENELHDNDDDDNLDGLF